MNQPQTTNPTAQVAVDIPKCSCEPCGEDRQILEPMDDPTKWRCPVTGWIYTFDTALGGEPELFSKPEEQETGTAEKFNLMPEQTTPDEAARVRPGQKFA